MDQLSVRKDDNAAYIIHCSMWQPHSTSKFSKYLILLGQLTARNEHLSDTDIVIRNKDNLQPRLSMAKKKKKKKL